MASDTKRQNAGTKVAVALPRSEPDAASSLISRDAVFKAVVGARIRITTAAPNQSTIEGTIFTADPISNFLVLYTSPAPSTSTTNPIQPGAYRFIQTSTITSFQLLTLPQPPPAPSSLHLDPSTLAPLAPTLNRRLTSTIHTLSQTESRRGPPSTTPLAQSIFDALSRSHPMRWHGPDAAMLFADEYLIEAPYGPDNCSIVKGAGSVQGLERLRKVLRMERDKIALKEGMGKIEGKLNAVGGKENRGVNVAAAGGVRKGG